MGKPRVAISTVEHKAVLDTCEALQKQGRIDLITIGVDRQAQIDLVELEQVCASGIKPPLRHGRQQRGGYQSIPSEKDSPHRPTLRGALPL